MDINEADRAYAAGIIDGEGYITISNNAGCQKYHQLKVTVVSTHYPLLRHLLTLWGGHIVTRQVKDPKRHKQSWAWCVESRLAAMLLVNIQQFSLIKSHHIDLALSFQKECIDPCRCQLTKGDILLREQYREEMGELNRRGPA